MTGGRRVPSPGRSSRDITTAYRLCVEIKHRKEKIPRWVRNMLAQAEADAEPGEIPVAIRHDKGDLWQNDVVFMTGESLMRILHTVGRNVQWERPADERESRA